MHFACYRTISLSRLILTRLIDMSNRAENSNAYVQALRSVAGASGLAAGQRTKNVKLSENTYCLPQNLKRMKNGSRKYHCNQESSDIKRANLHRQRCNWGRSNSSSFTSCKEMDGYPWIYCVLNREKFLRILAHILCLHRGLSALVTECFNYWATKVPPTLRKLAMKCEQHITDLALSLRNSI